MKAISKRVLSLGLSLAMVASVIAVPSTEAQAATGIAKSKTYYAGQTKTLKLTTSSSWKSVKTTWSTSKKSIVKIAKKTNNTVTINCVKAGKANVTAKVSFKKGTKKYTKKYTCKVTVKNPTFEVSAGQTTLKLGETTPIKVTKKPSSAVVKYSSDDAAIAKISGGKITATGVGTTKINARMKIGSQTVARKSVEITVVPAKDGLTATLLNPTTEDYPNTVLVNQTAVINVGYAMDGKPVPEKKLIMTTEWTDNGGNVHQGGALADETDSKGIGAFMISGGATKSTQSAFVRHVKYTISDPVTGTSVEGTVDFASVSLAPVVNVNNLRDGDKFAGGEHKLLSDDYANLVPGTNYKNQYTATDSLPYNDGIAYTASMDEPDNFTDEYVASQQVSLAGTDSHKVYFKGGYPQITLPKLATDQSAAEKQTQPVNISVNDYKTYVDDKQYIVLKEDPSKLTYATLNFDYLKLSKYTKVVIETYKTETEAKEAKVAPLDRVEYKGEQNQGAFGYQIPLDSNYAGVCVKVTLQSAGQVDDGMNDGYKINDIEYVYKTKTTQDGKTVPLKGATVKWSIQDSKFTAEKELSTAQIAAIGNSYFNLEAGGKVTIKTPVFPRTGTSVVTDYDANGKVEAYYALTAANNEQNQNDVFDYYAGVPYFNGWIYKITADELRDKVGQIVEDTGSLLTVDSKESGRTTLVGDVTVNGKKLDELDAETSTVYTSIQWNPIPNAEEAKNSDAYVALVGQNIEVVAQLIDKNGNAVTLANETMTFKCGDADATIDADADRFAGTLTPQATIVKIDKRTDAKGQAKLILKASDITTVTGVTAVAGNKAYDVKLMIAGGKTDRADLYWIDADLQFIDSVSAPTTTTTTDALNPNKTVSSGINPKTGSTWYYGVKTIGTTVSSNSIYGKLAGASITIDGMTVNMSKANGGVGTVETNTGVNGMVKASSTKTGHTKIVSKIDSTSITDSVKVTATKDGKTLDAIFAGTGRHTINKKLTLDAVWAANGVQAEIVAPNGTYVSGNSVDVYVKVTDANGNALPDRTVEFTADESNGLLSNLTVVTNADGVAKVTLNKGSNVRVTVTAKVQGISDEKYSRTYTWTNATALAINTDADEDSGEYQTVYNATDRTITMTFNNDIVESSVIAEQFTVMYGRADKVAEAIKLSVESVNVNGNVVTLKLANVPTQIDANAIFEVTVKSYTVGKVPSITYQMTSTEGAKFTNGTVIKFNATSAKESNPSQSGTNTFPLS